MTTTFNTPLDLEPLPAYRRDPEVISIISSAPSYTSDAPTYHSRRPSVPELEAPPAYPGIATAPARPNNNSHATTNATTSANTINNARTTSQSNRPRSPRQQEDPPRIGLPSQQYAPGFHARPVSNFDPHAYNVGAWSSITTSSRQLHAVARRRASSSATAILNSLSAVPPPLNSSIATLSSTASSPYSSSSSSSPSTNSSTAAVSSPAPLLPREDPDLVGEIAASRARNARLYRERCLRGEEGFRHEGRTWDFMLSQMNDWDERERSWRGFREQVGRTKLLGLGRRIGLRG